MSDAKQAEKACETCRHYLGGGNCNLSMEMECQDGGFEGWEPTCGPDYCEIGGDGSDG